MSNEREFERVGPKAVHEGEHRLGQAPMSSDARSGAASARLVDAAGAAALLGVSVGTFLRVVEPELARVRIGASFRYDVRDVEDWITSHKALGSETARATSELLTLSETARHLRVTVRTLSRWESEGRIRGVKMTAAKQGRKLFRRAEVERFLREAEGD